MSDVQIIEIGMDPDRNSNQDLETAFSIRRTVFCVEQGVSETEEMDGLDGICRQFIAISGGFIVGTARTRILAGGETKIERVAILKPHRGLGIGRLLMTRIMDNAASAMVLNAQTVTEEFYTKLGFIAEGPVFQEAGIDHIHMTQPKTEC
jgi:ElaA protein